MGDFNIAQFLGGIVEGMGKGLTSDKGGGAMNMEVIPKKKNAPPVIEMTPSQEAGQHIQEGAYEALQAPAMSIGIPIAAPQGGRREMPEVAGVQLDEMESGLGTVPLGGRKFGKPRMMRQMRFGGEVQDGETVEVGEAGKELVTKMPDGRVVVTPQEEVVDVNQQVAPNPSGTPAPLSADVMMQMQNPQYSEQENVALTTNRGADVTADRPPAMSLPDTVQQGPNDEGYLQNELLKNMEVKSSPWKDFGAALIQAGNNHFNNKNEPIRTWGEIQRDKRVAPLAAKLALVRDAKDRGMKTRLTNAQIAKAEGEPERLQTEIDRKNRLADLTEMRALNDGEYKRNLIALGREKAEEIKTNNEKMFELRQRGVDQNDERLQILRERNAVLARQGDERIRQGDERIEGARLSREDLNKYRGAVLTLKQAGEAKGLTPKQILDVKDRKTKLKVALKEKVRTKKMTQDEMDELLSEDAGFGDASGEVDK